MLERRKNSLSHAKAMRQAPSASETRLWLALRNRQLNGHKFSRQVPIGPFIADFVCRERNLVIEVDGVTHGDPHEMAKDEKRTKFLQSHGYHVHRVWSIEVFDNLNGVLDALVLLVEGKSAL